MSSETELVDNYWDAYRTWQDADEALKDVIATVTDCVTYLKSPATTVVELPTSRADDPDDNVIDSSRWPTLEKLAQLVREWREAAHIARVRFNYLPNDRRIDLPIIPDH